MGYVLSLTPHYNMAKTKDSPELITLRSLTQMQFRNVSYLKQITFHTTETSPYNQYVFESLNNLNTYHFNPTNISSETATSKQHF